MIWLLSFTGEPDRFTPPPQSLSYVRQYTLENREGYLATGDTVCYLSSFEKDYNKYLLTVSTDSVTVTFAILRTFSNPQGSQSYAVIAGQPDQPYVIHERKYVRGKTTYWFWSARPLRLYHETHKPIKGLVLDVSNQQLCE